MFEMTDNLRQTFILNKPTYRERTILAYRSLGYSPADVAHLLEATLQTINRHLRTAERKAGVQNRQQMMIYIMQNPQVLHQGGRGPIGIHAPSPTCACGYCVMMRGGMVGSLAAPHLIHVPLPAPVLVVPPAIVSVRASRARRL